MALMEGMTAIIMGSVFGGIFVITCFISSIKAVRDRRRLKKKIAARAKLLLETEEGNKAETETLPKATTSNGVSNNKPDAVTNDTHNIKPGCQDDINGVYNASFTPSSGDIETSCDRSNRNQVGKIPDKPHILKSRTLSGELYRRDRDSVAHLPPDCLAVQKRARRHSYEVAVAENSWMPLEPPSFASSEIILNTYRYGVNNKTQSTAVEFGNRVYGVGDRKTFTLTQKL